jgi:hypothetical protein
MQIQEIKGIQSLNEAQSLAIKGGARDTRGGKTTSTATIRTDGTAIAR